MSANNVLVQPTLHDSLRDRFVKLRGATSALPDASIVIPVNAQGDLENVYQILSDIARYQGSHHVEVVLVINNYPEGAEPAEIETFRALGVVALAIPNVRRSGEAVGFTARMQGARVASSEYVLLFDADCRIPDPTALINWYIKQFHSGARAAYTHVGYYGLPKHVSLRIRMMMHHTSRWVKRVILGIPTTRGSNYAFIRSLAVQYYDRGLMADEMNVGPTFKKLGGKVAYSGKKDLVVLTSGRMFRAGWLRLVRYFIYRLRYNLRVLPVGSDVAQRTKRENDPVRRYVDNVPIRDNESASSPRDSAQP